MVAHQTSAHIVALFSGFRNVSKVCLLFRSAGLCTIFVAEEVRLFWSLTNVHRHPYVTYCDSMVIVVQEGSLGKSAHTIPFSCLPHVQCHICKAAQIVGAIHDWAVASQCDGVRRH